MSKGESLSLSSKESADLGKAVELCKQHVEDAYGSQLISSSYDSHSSHSTDTEHKVFLYSEVAEGEQGISAKTQSICWVSIFDGELQLYRQYSIED